MRATWLRARRSALPGARVILDSDPVLRAGGRLVLVLNFAFATQAAQFVMRLSPRAAR